MARFSTLRRLVLSGLVAVASVTAFGTGTASACDYTPRYAYKTVTVYEIRNVPYTHFITQYDHCGKPYQVARTSYNQVQVAVQKLVKVAY